MHTPADSCSTLSPVGLACSRNSLSRAARHAAALSAVILAGSVLVGCYSEGGPGYSGDQHTYVSTSWQPKTITLKDTRTGQAYWSIDVPVGRKLVMQFRENQGSTGQTFGDSTPDMMLWDLMAPDENFGPLDNQVPVPPKEARRIDMTLRASPELPETMGGGVPRRDPATTPPASTTTPPADK